MLGSVVKVAPSESRVAMQRTGFCALTATEAPGGGKKSNPIASLPEHGFPTTAATPRMYETSPVFGNDPSVVPQYPVYVVTSVSAFQVTHAKPWTNPKPPSSHLACWALAEPAAKSTQVSATNLVVVKRCMNPPKRTINATADSRAPWRTGVYCGFFAEVTARQSCGEFPPSLRGRGNFR